ncbi:Stearoyl-CoA desaturase 5 [Halotydeus destructor]|nr:Stearoyl-CoA desaturase 5 [Halotydeus destructor]
MVLLNDMVYHLLHNDTAYTKMTLKKSPGVSKLKGDRVFYFVEEDFFKTHRLSASIIVVGHLGMFYSFACMYHQVPYNTILWAGLLQLYSYLCLTSGVHAMWSHKSYQASWPLKVFFMIGHTLNAQYTIHTWASEHRCHHKWSETDGDPHNPNRGPFFAHVGFALHKRHPAALERYESLNYDDISNDPVAKFHTDMILPTAVPVYFWNESLITSILLVYLARTIGAFHSMVLINSAAHLFGDRPYKEAIGAADSSIMSKFTLGSGYHNFHHTFPQDYRSSEADVIFNPVRDFIELMAHFGLAFNLKWTSDRTIQAVRAKTLANKALAHGHFDNYPAKYKVKWPVEEDHGLPVRSHS